jgi:hypothetical protein
MKSGSLGRNNTVTGNVVRSVGAAYAMYLAAQEFLTVTGNNIAWEHDAGTAMTGVVLSVLDVTYSSFSGNLVRCADTGDNVSLRALNASGTSNLQISGNHFSGTATDLTAFAVTNGLDVSDKAVANSWN